MDTLRNKLKSATMAAHMKIEANPILATLTRPDLNEDRYRAILLRYFGFFDALETKLRATDAAAHIPDFESRVRTPRLHSDLLALGLLEDAIAKAPRCQDLPPTQTLSQMTGTMYVTEGSTLGGMLIAKHLRTLSFISADRLSFFSDDPQIVSARWKAFIDCLETTPNLNEHEALDAAAQTFTKLDLWMEGASSD